MTIIFFICIGGGSGYKQLITYPFSQTQIIVKQAKTGNDMQRIGGNRPFSNILLFFLFPQRRRQPLQKEVVLW